MAGYKINGPSEQEDLSLYCTQALPSNQYNGHQDCLLKGGSKWTVKLTTHSIPC
jgi:hypothetical protein